MINKHIIFYHDENEIETVESQAKQIGEIMVKSIEWAGEYLKLNCPVTGEYKIGKTWGDVH